MVGKRRHGVQEFFDQHSTLFDRLGRPDRLDVKDLMNRGHLLEPGLLIRPESLRGRLPGGCTRAASMEDGTLLLVKPLGRDPAGVVGLQELAVTLGQRCEVVGWGRRVR